MSEAIESLIDESETRLIEYFRAIDDPDRKRALLVIAREYARMSGVEFITEVSL